MRSRTSFPLITASLLLLATGCASSTTGSPSDGGGSSTVHVGALLSMTGVYATLGPAEKQAMTMGVEALNRTGFTVAGKPHTLAIDYADDKSDPATSGVVALRQMTQAQGLPVVAFGLGSATYVPQLRRRPVAMINIVDSSYPSILGLSPDIFLTRSSSASYVPGCLDYASRQLGAKTVAVITAQGEPYGEGLTKLVQQDAARYGLTVVGTGQYPLGATDYSAAVHTAVAAEPDAIYLSSVTGVILPVLKQLRQSGWTGPVLHSSGVNAEQAAAALGDGYGTLMRNNFDCAGTMPATSPSPSASDFGKAFRTRWGQYPQDLTMWAYDYPFIVAAAMTKAGSTGDAPAIIRALSRITVPTGSVSGWIPDAGGLLFADRQARTLSDVTVWCPASKSIAPAMVFDLKDGAITDRTLTADPCK